MCRVLANQLGDTEMTSLIVLSSWTLACLFASFYYNHWNVEIVINHPLGV